MSKSKKYTIKIYCTEKLICKTLAAPGTNLLRCIVDAGVFLDAPCGGNGRCGKCLVRLSRDGEQIPACRIDIVDNLDVYIPEEQEMVINTSSINSANPVSPPHCLDNKQQCNSSLGIAVDIGTTTVVAHLQDIKTGKRLATASAVNAQRPYGADVASRIRYCAEHGNEKLTKLIREQVTSLINETCTLSKTQTGNIEYISIAANTIMQHIVAGYSPVSMGAAPFTTICLFGEELPVWSDLPVAENTKIYYTPAISAYVGGDITAGLLAAGFDEKHDPAIFLDIGTNGEIVLKHEGTYYCCATAAGPAFEGAEISMGMAAVSGAIDHVKWNNGIEFSTIGGGKPCGLCGSGLLDTLAVLLESGAVDETGRLLDKDKYWLTKNNGEEPAVYITAGDIRNLQLAKAAIAAGIQVLLHTAGILPSDVKKLALAGGFGSYMDLQNAARIGLFPKELLSVSKSLGNTAGEGAAISLGSKDARERLDKIRTHCEYIELSSSTLFNDKFIEHMTFED